MKRLMRLVLVALLVAVSILAMQLLLVSILV